jgi:hypothetical protein
VCAVDSAVNEEGLEEEQCYEQELGDQDPGQESPEGWENDKCNPTLDAYCCPRFYKHNLWPDL